MKLISVNAGLPRQIQWRGRTETTGIFKQPVSGRTIVRTLNVAGDGQADLTVHGGIDKAVYAYPSEHYGFWRQELPDVELQWGAFGENLTIQGLDEEDVRVGDRFRIGDAELIATEPRLPCYKLGIRFGRDDMVKRFLASRRTGFYLAVTREGSVGAGDRIERVARQESAVTIADLTRIHAFERDDGETMHRALRTDRLPESWKAGFRERLAKIRG